MVRWIVAAALVSAAMPATAASFFAVLSGDQEVPPVMTPATGEGRITVLGDIMRVLIDYRDLTTPLTVAHIHCCAPRGMNAGVAVDLDKIPLPQTLSGSFERMFDLSMDMTYSASFLNANGGTAAGARAALLSAFNAETAYINLHTQRFPPGEIRGQIAVVPEPGTWAMLIAGFGLVGGALRRRRPVAAA
jgi:hypothetical protein